MRRRLIVGVFTVLVLISWCGAAEAARNLVAPQSPTPNAPVTMGSLGSLTYQIAHQNTGGNTGERIYEVRFRVGGGGGRGGRGGRGGGGAASTFASTTAAPAGWIRTASAFSLPATAGGYSITSTETDASSTNQEISWAFINNGCAAIDNVAINFPAGWVWGGGSEDSYPLVRVGGGALVENMWSVAGTVPVTFTAPTVADRQVVGENGNYRLTFSSTPTATGSSITVTITDANGDAATVPSTVTVNSYNFNSLNDANSLIWQEQFR